MGLCYDFNHTIKCGNIRVPLSGTNLDKKDLIIAVLLFLVNIVSSAFATVGNGCICYIVIMKERFQTPSNIILASLALTDFLVGALVQPIFVTVILIQIVSGKYYCYQIFALYFLSFACAGTSIWTLLIMTVERWFAVTFPFKHSRLVTKKRCYWCLIYIWTIISSFSLLGTLRLYSQEIINILTMTSSLISVIITIICYGMIFIQIKRQQRINHVLGCIRTSEQESNDVVETSSGRMTRRTNLKIGRKQNRVFTKEHVIAAFIIVLIICYAPKSFEKQILHSMQDKCYQGTLYCWLTTFVYLNSRSSSVFYRCCRE